MKLRSKLVLLVAGAAAFFLASVTSYFAILNPLEAMESEIGAFQELSRATASLQIDAGLLVLRPIGPQAEVLQESILRFQKAQEGMSKVVLLPKTNPELAAAVEAVVNLGELSRSGLQAVTSSVEQLMDMVRAADLPVDTVDWSQVIRAAASGEIPDGGVALYTLSNISSQLSALDDALTVTRQVVEKKDGEIAGEVRNLKSAGSVVGLSVIVVSVVVAVLLSLVLSRNITRALSTLGSTVAKVAAGDLRVRFKSQRKDELGALSRDIDALLEALTSAFQRIQGASAENIEVREQLVQSVATATSSAVQIEANSSSILGQLKRVDERIQSSQADLNGVVILLAAFHGRLSVQNQGVGDASKAVADLAQGIARISELSHQNRQAVEALLAESDRGREVFDRSFAKVAEISDSVSAIQDLVGAIADIASQTNILSLNAAIEAAHAGEAGKGFAVVADEISKLASASAASSALIAETIQEVVEKILEAGATREETLGAFDSIGTQIGKVSQQGRGIYSEADRMNQGTHRIREAMETLSTTSEDTTQEADRIGTVTTKLGDALGQVGRISHEVVSNIGEITSGLAEISRTISEVSAQSDRLRRVGQELDQAVNAFQTEETEALEEIPEEKP